MDRAPPCHLPTIAVIQPCRGPEHWSWRKEVNANWSGKQSLFKGVEPPPPPRREGRRKGRVYGGCHDVNAGCSTVVLIGITCPAMPVAIVTLKGLMDCEYQSSRFIQTPKTRTLVMASECKPQAASNENRWEPVMNRHHVEHVTWHVWGGGAELRNAWEWGSCLQSSPSWNTMTFGGSVGGLIPAATDAANTALNSAILPKMK